MQYFNRSKNASSDNDERGQIRIINSKIKLQWKCLFRGNGTFQLICRGQAAENIGKWFATRTQKLFNSLHCRPCRQIS